MLDDKITLIRKGETTSFVPENFRIEVDSINAAKAAALAGLGIQHLPVSEVEDHLKRGDLVEVLSSWQLPDLGVYAVWSDIGPQKRLTRRLLDFLADR